MSPFLAQILSLRLLFEPSCLIVGAGAASQENSLVRSDTALGASMRIAEK